MQDQGSGDIRRKRLMWDQIRACMDGNYRHLCTLPNKIFITQFGNLIITSFEQGGVITIESLAKCLWDRMSMKVALVQRKANTRFSLFIV